MGFETYRLLIAKTKRNFVYLKQSMEQLASKHGERVIETRRNHISIGKNVEYTFLRVFLKFRICLNFLIIAMTLAKIASKVESTPEACIKIITQLGGMLFRRHVGGCRVVTGKEVKTVESIEFIGWGAHCTNYPDPYLTAAATIGMETKDIDAFIKKLDECYRKVQSNFDS